MRAALDTGTHIGEHTEVPALEGVDVVVLLAPDRNDSTVALLDAIAEIKLREHTAVLVVFTRTVDGEVVGRTVAAGADAWVVTPRAADLFGHIERARTRYRHTHDAAPAQ